MTDVMRAEFKPVSEANKTLAKGVKDAFNELHDYLGTCPQGRCMSIALTNLEQASMWAVKEITAPEHQDAASS